MKKFNLLYTGLASAFLLATTSCSDYLDVNTNPNYPAEASPSTLLPSGIAGVASATGAFMNYMAVCGLSNIHRDIRLTSIIHW